MLKKTKLVSRGSRAPNLTERRILEIVQLLDAWTGKLTWDALIAKVAATTHCAYTRQALDRHARIKLAYQTTKERLANAPRKAGLTKLDEQRRLAAYDKLVGENARLARENNALLEQFARWAYNASLRGVSGAQLNAPLPTPNRGQATP